MSKSKLYKSMVLFAVFFLSIIPLDFFNAQAQKNTSTTLTLTPTPTINPTPTLEPQQQFQLPSTPEIVFTIVVGVFSVGLIINLIKKRSH